MSHEARSWALACPILGPLKSVLLALAIRSDDEDKCWPSIDTVASDAGISRRCAQVAVRDLEAMGLLSAEGMGGRGLTRMYRLKVGAEPRTRPERVHVTQKRVHVTQKRVHVEVETPAPRAPEPSREPIKEPPVNGTRQTAMILPMVGGRAAEPKAHRIPPGWGPDANGIAFCRDLGLDHVAVLAKFTDYWIGIGGQRAKKTDWPATWRNWCRDEAKRAPARRLDEPRQSPSSRARMSHFQPPAWHSEAPTIDGEPVKESA